MTEQPPSASKEALDLAERIRDWQTAEWVGAKEIDALCEQRVSAETERCARLLEQVADPADESEIGEEAADAFNGGGHKRSMTDRLVSWNAVLAKAILAPAERPAPQGPPPDAWTEEGIRAADAKAEELHRYFHH